MRRRTFLKTVAATGAAALAAGAVYGYRAKIWERSYPGAISGATFKFGHQLKKNAAHAPPDTREKIETIIVGGGIAGLSAAWWLQKNGYDNFVLLELEHGLGGNSQFRTNAISSYPLGAHYLPLPPPEARFVRMLLEELGVIRGYDRANQPIYEELYLCADPKERLFMHGRWHDGLLPQSGLTAADRRQYEEFFTAMERYKHLRGRDGKKAFAIPVDLSSQDPELLALDRISMTAFMRDQGWTSRYLNWYVTYGCRDDYGVGPDHISAWAGIHYFASRVGAGANADGQDVLTWPEGNGWLVARLQEKISTRARVDAMAYAIDQDKFGVTVDYLETATGRRKRIAGKQVIFAAPRFIAPKLIAKLPTAQRAPTGVRYAPWLVANISLTRLPSGEHAALSWDNVNYHSRALGYIVATHQNLTLHPTKTVITYYLPLDEQDPAQARKAALNKTHAQWAGAIVADLSRMHPAIADDIEWIDVWIWGHGMSSPDVGFLWSEARRAMRQPAGRIHFAHSDMSGISLFEEAQYRGVQAAQQVLAAVAHG